MRERGQLVQIAIIQGLERLAQDVRGETYIDHDVVRVKPLRPELRIHDIGGAVHALRRTEHLAAQRVGHHDVIANCYEIHEVS